VFLQAVPCWFAQAINDAAWRGSSDAAPQRSTADSETVPPQGTAYSIPWMEQRGCSGGGESEEGSTTATEPTAAAAAATYTASFGASLDEQEQEQVALSAGAVAPLRLERSTAAASSATAVVTEDDFEVADLEVDFDEDLVVGEGEQGGSGVPESAVLRGDAAGVVAAAQSTAASASSGSLTRAVQAAAAAAAAVTAAQAPSPASRKPLSLTAATSSLTGKVLMDASDLLIDMDGGEGNSGSHDTAGRAPDDTYSTATTLPMPLPAAALPSTPVPLEARSSSSVGGGVDSRSSEGGAASPLAAERSQAVLTRSGGTLQTVVRATLVSLGCLFSRSRGGVE
jgi:hypothetical protein